MSKIKEVNDIPLNIILPINYEALQQVDYFTIDAQRATGLANNIFRGGMNTGDPATTALIAAVNNSLKESLADISAIQGFLNQIITCGDK